MEVSLFLGSSCETGMREEKHSEGFGVTVVKLPFEVVLGGDSLYGVIVDEDTLNTLPRSSGSSDIKKLFILM